jgi:hypothetical protein
MSKILYIAGYGRSGSTVLDITLGNHAVITGVGEVTQLLDDYAGTNRKCSCGLPYRECSFWRDFFPNGLPAAELIQLVRKLERLSFVPRLLLGWVAKKDREAYRAYHRKLFSHVVSRTGKTMVVDSSKSARKAAARFLALSRLAGEDVYVIHLVRNGLATMESLTVTGSNWALEGCTQASKWPGLRSALGWVSTNLWTSLLGRVLPEHRYILIFYEDLVANPATALKKIGQFCGFDPLELIARIDRNDDFEVGHRVGGNRVRLQSKIKFLRGGNPYCGDTLKLSHRLVFGFTGEWLNRCYRYGRHRAEAEDRKCESVE